MRCFVLLAAAVLLVTVVSGRPQTTPASCAQLDDDCGQEQVYKFDVELKQCVCVDLKDARQLDPEVVLKPAINKPEGKPEVPTEGKPVVPIETKPAVPTEVPTEGKPVVPIETKPAVPAEVPSDGRPVVPVETKPAVPSESKPVETASETKSGVSAEPKPEEPVSTLPADVKPEESPETKRKETKPAKPKPSKPDDTTENETKPAKPIESNPDDTTETKPAEPVEAKPVVPAETETEGESTQGKTGEPTETKPASPVETKPADKPVVDVVVQPDGDKPGVDVVKPEEDKPAKVEDKDRRKRQDGEVKPVPSDDKVSDVDSPQEDNRPGPQNFATNPNNVRQRQQPNDEVDVEPQQEVQRPVVGQQRPVPLPAVVPDVTADVNQNDGNRRKAEEASDDESVEDDEEVEEIQPVQAVNVHSPERRKRQENEFENLPEADTTNGDQLEERQHVVEKNCNKRKVPDVVALQQQRQQQQQQQDPSTFEEGQEEEQPGEQTEVNFDRKKRQEDVDHQNHAEEKFFGYNANAHITDPLTPDTPQQPIVGTGFNPTDRRKRQSGSEQVIPENKPEPIDHQSSPSEVEQSGDQGSGKPVTIPAEVNKDSTLFALSEPILVQQQPVQEGGNPVVVGEQESGRPVTIPGNVNKRQTTHPQSFGQRQPAVPVFQPEASFAERQDVSPIDFPGDFDDIRTPLEEQNVQGQTQEQTQAEKDEEFLASVNLGFTQIGVEAQNKKRQVPVPDVPHSEVGQVVDGQVEVGQEEEQVEADKTKKVFVKPDKKKRQDMILPVE